MNARLTCLLALAALFLLGCPGAPTCDFSKLETIDHSSLSGSELWDAGTHHVSTTISIGAGSTLTLAPCARVVLDPDVGFAVSGQLVAKGTASQPISFERAQAGSAWGAISVSPNAAAKVELASVTLSGGGGAAPTATSSTLGAPLYAQGSGNTPPGVMKLNDVVIDGATGVGVALINAAFDPTSTNLTVKGAGSFAAYLGFDVIDTVPTGTYTGNARDGIALQTAYYAGQANDRTLTHSLTVRDRGVPYVVGMKDGSRLLVRGAAGAAVPTVTVQPGVTFAFTKGATAGGELVVDGDPATNPTRALGALIAVGDPAKPIVFTSAEPNPAPGDWGGLRFLGVDSTTQLTGVQILFAGANSGLLGTCTTNPGTTTSQFNGDAALQVKFSQGTPAASFLSHSTISQSAGNGVYRGWNGPDLDFVAGNTVTQVAWCTQTLVPDNLNACHGMCATSP